MKQVIVMQGVSGSGKSTAIDTLSAKYSPSKMVVCSADHYFVDASGKYKFNGADLPLAHISCFASFIEALQKGVPLVFVDNTNLNTYDVSPYMLAASALGYDAKIVRVECEDLALAAERNWHDVPLTRICSQYAALKAFQNPYGWRIDTFTPGS